MRAPCTFFLSHGCPGARPHTCSGLGGATATGQKWQGTHQLQDGLGFTRLAGLGGWEDLEPGAQAAGVGQRDGAGCGLSYHVTAKADELLVQGELSEDTGVSWGHSKPAWCPILLGLRKG